MTEIKCPKCGGENMHLIGSTGFDGNMEVSESLSRSIYFGCEHCHPWLYEIGQIIFNNENGREKLHSLYIETQKGVSNMEWRIGE